MRATSPVRRLAVAAGLLIAVLVACGREITAPVSSPIASVFKRVAAFAFEPKYETAIPAGTLHAALQQVAFERVRITLRREDGTIALDTVVLFPVGAESLTVSLIVPLPANAPASGVPLSLNLGYVNAAGDTVFKGGPLPVTVTPGTGGTPPAPVQVPVQYTGPGATATSVVIAPRTASGQPGQGVNFTAQALSASGQVMPNTPVVFTSSNPAVVRVDATSGVASFEGRGAARVYAQLLTGPFDSATVTVTLPAARISLVSGADQTGLAGSTLGSPVVAKVQATDGVGVGGVTVTFAASNGGTPTPATAVSASDGTVSTQWKLGAAAGAQALTITSTGLAGSPLTVNATARAVTATKLVMGTQPVNGTAGAALAPVTVAAQDVDGNVVTSFTGDVTVALGANPGSATLGGTTTVKAVAGVATFSGLTLSRPGTGYTLVFSSAPLTAATSSTFTIAVGAANQLAFTGVPEFAQAGVVVTRAVTVAVQDSVGNPVTSFTGAITLALGTSPTGATLVGTLTRNAVNGVATFNDIKFTRVGRTTLAASATNLRGSTSAAIAVLPGPAASLEVVSGDGQKAAAGTQLGEITVRLSDAQDNGIPDAAIAFAVTGGGGTVASATAKTDVDGKARVLWTIGAGPQTLSATYAGRLSTSITATATGASLVWTGATSTDWNTASNWSPAFAPTGSDAVTIPVTPNTPTIGAPASVVSVVVATGATLTNNSTLTVNSSVDAGTTITGSGSVVLAGASGTLKGVINQALTVSGGAYTLAGATQVTGPLTINASGKLTVGGQTLTVVGSLATSGSGRLAMSNSADVVAVTGDVTFAGGSESGFLTAGVLAVGGNFTATSSTFSASGSHALQLVGATTPQTLSFASPVAGQGINHLSFANGAAKTMSGAVQVMGDVTIEASSAPVAGSATVKIGGDFTDATVLPIDSGGTPDPLGGWRVANTNFFGSNKVINSTFITSNVTVSGTVRLAPCTSCVIADRFAGLLADDGYAKVNGDVTVAGTGAVLKVNGNHYEVMGNFATASGGSLDMTDANDLLDVKGSATFGGGSTAGKLTLGTLKVIQDFTQSGSANSFAPAASFTTYIGDPYYGGGLRASRAQQARLNDARVPRSAAVEAARNRRMQQVVAVRAERAARLAKLDRRAAAYARLGMAAPARGEAANRGSAAAGEAYRLLRPRRDYSGTSTITFANPTSSFFGTLYLSGPGFVLASDVQVAAELETGSSSAFTVYSSSATPRKITSHGADVSDLGFNNVSWTLLDGSDVWAMDWVVFDNMDPTADQFTVARTSDELAACDGECSAAYYYLYYWTFNTAPTTGNYIKASDTNGGPNVLELYMSSPDPSVHGGHVSTFGGALISNWPETSVVTWLGTTSTDWNVASNWSGGVVPTDSDDVVIPTGIANNPQLSADGYARNLTIETGKHINTSCNELYVYGNVVARLDSAAVRTCEGDAIHLMGDGSPFNTVVGYFDVVKVEGNYKVSGTGSQLIVNEELRVYGGNLTINGGRVDVGGVGGVGNGTFLTDNLGTLTMTDPADQLFLGAYGAYFRGGSTTGRLTAGTITLGSSSLGTEDPLVWPGAALDAFAPSGTHLVVINSYASFWFFDPAQSFLRNVQISGGGTMAMEGNTLVTGTLARGAGSGAITVTAGGQVLTVNGLNQSGADVMQFNNTRLNLTGTSGVTFNNVQFVGYGTGFFGESLFEVNRSGGPYTFTGLDFSLAGFAPDTTRHYVKNSGSANIELVSALPAPVQPTFFITTGGTVTWP